MSIALGSARKSTLCKNVKELEDDMKRKISVTLLALAAFLYLTPGAASAADAGKGKLSGDDADFVKAAASGGMMEVQLGKMAAEKASNSQVKEFGRRMQKDHSKANDELKKIAAKKDVKLPAELDAKHKATVNKLSKLKSEEFDREYMEAMVDDHKEDLEKFQQQADKGKDPELKKFAQDHVPILKKHLELAEQTQKKASGGAKGGGSR
jgi:putative membrane protein